MITQAVIAEKILDYLNGKLDLAGLVHWSEDVLLMLVESEDDIPNRRRLMDVLGYIGAGDTPDFPLTWEILTDFLEQLGTKVKVIAEAR